MKVRGAVLREMGLPGPYAESRPLQVEEFELDPPGPGELLVKVGAAGLCHSDLSVINGSRPRVMPMVLGHEAAGRVVAIGDGGSREFQVGDLVVLTFVPSCGTCQSCSSGRAALCEPGAAANTAGTLLSGSRHLHSSSGDDLNHHLGVSAFSDHVVVSDRSAVRVENSLPPEIASLFGCAVLTGVGAALNSAEIQPGERTAVFGLGGVGLAALIGARFAGAEQIVAVDLVPEKLELARDLGATDLVKAGPGAVDEIRELTGGGAEKVIETVGSAAVLGEAYRATRRGGTTVTVGLPDPEQMLEIQAVSLVAEERTLKGSYLGSSTPKRDIPRYIGYYEEGRLPVDRLLTDQLPLEDINEGFDRLASGLSVRSAVIF